MPNQVPEQLPAKPDTFKFCAAARYLNISRETLRRARRKGTGPEPVETPDGPRWMKHDLDFWIANLRRRPVYV